jgi:hypothetical protein
MADNSGLDRPMCFLHTFKTGGVSLGNFLQDYFGEENTINGVNKGMKPVTNKRDPDTGSISTRHLNFKDVLKYRYIRGHIPYSFWVAVPDHEKPYLTTIIRDPIPRIVSYYHFFKSWKGYKSERVKRLRVNCKSLSDFVSLPIYDLNSNLDNFQCKFFSGINIIDDEVDYSKYREQEFYEMAITNLENFFFVGITELSEISLMLLASKMGAPKAAKIYRENTFEENNASDRHIVIAKEQLTPSDYQVLNERNYYDNQLREHFIWKLNQEYIRFAGLS